MGVWFLRQAARVDHRRPLGEVIVLCSAGAAVDAVPVASCVVVGSPSAFVTSSSEDSSRKGPLNMSRA
jgi:hypothetical protein